MKICTASWRNTLHEVFHNSPNSPPRTASWRHYLCQFSWKRCLRFTKMRCYSTSTQRMFQQDTYKWVCVYLPINRYCTTRQTPLPLQLNKHWLFKQRETFVPSFIQRSAEMMAHLDRQSWNQLCTTPLCGLRTFGDERIIVHLRFFVFFILRIIMLLFWLNLFKNTHF